MTIFPTFRLLCDSPYCNLSPNLRSNCGILHQKFDLTAAVERRHWLPSAEELWRRPINQLWTTGEEYCGFDAKQRVHQWFLHSDGPFSLHTWQFTLLTQIRHERSTFYHHSYTGITRSLQHDDPSDTVQRLTRVFRRACAVNKLKPTAMAIDLPSDISKAVPTVAAAAAAGAFSLSM